MNNRRIDNFMLTSDRDGDVWLECDHCNWSELLDHGHYNLSLVLDSAETHYNEDHKVVIEGEVLSAEGTNRK